MKIKLFTLTLAAITIGLLGSCNKDNGPDVPEGMTLVSSANEIFSAIDNQSGTVNLFVKYSDTPYDFIGVYTSETEKFAKIVGDVHICGELSKAGKKPVLSGLTFSLGKGSTALHLEGLVFDGQKEGTLCANPEAAMSKVEYVNCDITNFSKSIYSNGSSDTGSFADFLIDGCYIHNSSNSGHFIDVRGGVNGNILIQNSTFHAMAKTFIRASDHAKLDTAKIQNCTFNYVTATSSPNDNAGIFHVRQSTEAKSLQCLNNVFLNQYNENEDAGDVKKCWVRMARNSTDSYSPYCSGNIYYHVGAAWWTSSAPGAPSDLNAGIAFSQELGMKDGLMLTEDPCENSKNGDLHLTSKGAEIISRKAGDPRWRNAQSK